MQRKNSETAAPAGSNSNMQQMMRQLARFIGSAQGAESRGDKTFRATLKKFKELPVDNKHSDHYFEAMQVLYDGDPDATDRHYSKEDIKAFTAVLKLYALANCTQNRTPHATRKKADVNEKPMDFASVCGRYAAATDSRDKCNSRIRSFLDSKRIESNFRDMENIVSRMGKAGYRFDYVSMLRDIGMMFSKSRALSSDTRKRWAEQYVRSSNKSVAEMVNETNERN